MVDFVGIGSICFANRRALLYSFGCGADGRLGTGAARDESMPVCVCDNLEFDVVAIAGGYHHTAVIDAHGDLFTCGLNRYGQLGIDPRDSAESLSELTLIPEMRNRDIVGVDCG